MLLRVSRGGFLYPWSVFVVPVKHRYSEEFLAQYKDREPAWGPVGWIVFKRTYARWVPSEKRKEFWWESCRRILEGNFNLVPDDPTITQQEMELAYDLMWNFYWLPAGRGLWISGTEVANKIGSTQNNCWGVNLEPMPYTKGGPLKASTPFVFSVDKLMLGGGVGTNATRETVAKFDPVATKVNLFIVCDPEHENYRELNANRIPSESHTYLRLKDSRRGWTDAYRVVIDASFKKTPYEYNLVIDVSDIRPRGRRIKGFGGVSEGPAPLVLALREINALLNQAVGRNLTPLECADIIGYGAKATCSGNVRRSAIIHVFSPDDVEAYTSKEDEAKFNEVRWTANISVAVDDAFDDYEKLVPHLSKNGEPGYVNFERFRDYGRYADGVQKGIDAGISTVNPCAEIGLVGKTEEGPGGEPCNLVELFPYNIFRDGKDFKQISQIGYRYAKRVTCADYSDWPGTEAIINENRRLGIGLSGWEDFKAWSDFYAEGEDHRRKELDEAYLLLRAYDKEYSAILGVPESIKLTTMKPSGSISKLCGASSGRHPHWSRWYIQRISFSKSDLLLPILREAGFPVEPALTSPNTYIVEFPVKAASADLPGFKAADDYTLEEHMQDQYFLQHWWADNSISSTLTFLKSEVNQIAGLLRKYKFKSTSLLPYNDHTYKQAPWEAISEEDYESRVAQIKFWPSDKHLSTDRRDAELVDMDECEGGACPIR